jgi:hypothetical protein
MRLKSIVLSSCALVAIPTVGMAQTPVPPSQTQSAADGRGNCTSTRAMPGEGTIAPSDQTTGQGRESLGDKLAKSDGVLCPPADVDPQMRAPTPDAGNTLVIPPPGSPGGDPSIRPK